MVEKEKFTVSGDQVLQKVKELIREGNVRRVRLIHDGKVIIEIPLSVGAPADISVLRLEHGSFGFVDVHGARMRGSQKLVGELTIREGKVVWDLTGITREDWDKLGAKYKSQGDASWDGTLGHTVRARK